MALHWQTCALMWLAAITATCSAAWQVQQVQFMSRHGQRTLLLKSPFTFQETGTAALTPLGVFMCYSIGSQLRSRYMTDGAPTFIPNITTYNSNYVQMNSSNLDRTLVSAQGIKYGLYPPATLLGTENTTTSELPLGYQAIPIYSNVDGNDIIIRAYDKCPTFDNNVENLYTSPEFVAFSSNHSDFFRFLEGALIPSGNCVAEAKGVQADALAGFYNLFDCINTLNQTNPTFITTLFNQTIAAEIQNTVDYLESAKYNQSIAGRMLGGPWLGKVNQDFTAAMSANSSLRIRITSAHYPVLKGVLAALDISEQVYGIPDYASYLLIELLKSDTSPVSYGVRLLFQDGYNGTLALLALKNVVQDSEGVMSYSDWTNYLTNKGVLYNNLGEWCTECSNQQADVCLAQQVAALTAAGAGVSLSSSKGDEDHTDAKIAAAAVVGSVGGIALGALGFLLWGRHRQRKSTLSRWGSTTSDQHMQQA